MSITDVTFLFVFLPLALCTYVLKPALQKYLLLMLSLFFYACGSPRYFFLFMVAVGINIIFGVFIEKFRERNLGKIFLITGCVLNIAVLFYYKYYNFTVLNLNRALHTSFEAKQLLIPLGISFFVFKAISYLVDIYTQKIDVGKNPVYAALYMSFFGQIASGPICRYGKFYEVYEENRDKREIFAEIANGGYRFTIGFIKKVLVAKCHGTCYNGSCCIRSFRCDKINIMAGILMLFFTVILRFFWLFGYGNRYWRNVWNSLLGKF